VTRPEDLGQKPDGGALEAEPAGPGASDVTWSTRQLLRERNFWMIALPFALIFSALSAVLIHLVPFAADLGIEGYRAGSVLSVAAGAGVLGKVIFGRLVDRGDPRRAVWASFGTQTAGLLVLMHAGGFAQLVAGGLVFGFGMGGVVPLQGAVSGRVFGRLSFGRVMGLMRPVQVPLHAVGIPLAAGIHDATGSFEIAFRIFVGVYVASGLAIGGLRVAPPRTARSGREARLA
jgi:MFS family permease